MARSATGRSQIANGKKGGGTPAGRAAQARAAAKKPGYSGGGKFTTVSDSITRSATSLLASAANAYNQINAAQANTSTPGAASARRVGGSGSARGYAGAGGGGSAAAAAAAQAAAYRQGIVDQYVTPTNTLYDTATGAVGKDFAPTAAAYNDASVQMGQDATWKVNDARQRMGQQRADRAAYVANALGKGFGASTSASSERGRATGKSMQDYDRTVGQSYKDMFATQTGNAGGRIQSVIDAMNDERKKQLAAIAQTYGITL